MSLKNSSLQMTKKNETAKVTFYFEDVADGFPLSSIKAMQKRAKMREVTAAGIELVSKKDAKIRKR